MDHDKMSEIWLPILTFILGCFVTQIGEVWRDGRRCRREDQLRELERAGRTEDCRIQRRREYLDSLRQVLIVVQRGVSCPPDPSDMTLGYLDRINEAEIDALSLAESIDDTELSRCVEVLIELGQELSRVTSYSRSNDFEGKFKEFDELYKTARRRIGRLAHLLS